MVNGCIFKLLSRLPHGGSRRWGILENLGILTPKYTNAWVLTPSYKFRHPDISPRLLLRRLQSLIQVYPTCACSKNLFRNLQESTPGPLHGLCSLPGCFPSDISHDLMFHFLSGLCSNVTFSVRTSLITLFNPL